VADYNVFEAGDVTVQGGETLVGAKLAYRTYGTLSSARDNAIIYPTRIMGRHSDNEFLIGEGRALDTQCYYIIVPNLLGNGLSSSPSNTPPPLDRANFPDFTIYDNVVLQHRLVTEVLGVEDIALAVGWSMGAQQVYHWAALYPGMVKRIAPIAGSARTSPHNYVFLEGMKAALQADSAWKGGRYDEPPVTGLRAIGRAWAGWGFSQAFYREERYRDLGYQSVDDFIVGYWEAMMLQRDANNMLSQMRAWQKSDISANDVHGGNFEAALGTITARAYVMPGATDLYFTPEDAAYEVRNMPNAELRVIPSVWGHAVGGGRNPQDLAFIEANIRELLAEPAP
jgi:homoserine O-acetyltransferase